MLAAVFRAAFYVYRVPVKPEEGEGGGGGGGQFGTLM